MRPHILESKYQFLSLLRTPRYSVATLLFPAMFYVFFGLMLPRGGPNAAKASVYSLVMMSGFGVMGAALWSLGAGIANERGQGWLQVKRATPMPPAAYFVWKVCGAMMFSTLTLLLLFALGLLFGNVRMDPWQGFLVAARWSHRRSRFVRSGFYLATFRRPIPRRPS